MHQVDNSNNNVVICWTMTGIVYKLYRIYSSTLVYDKHTRVPDRQQYDRHMPITSYKRKYDTWRKYVALGTEH